jgi:hypothetical protein
VPSLEQQRLSEFSDEQLKRLSNSRHVRPSPTCKEHIGAQINKVNQNKTVGIYGGNLKIAAGVPLGSFMHVHQEMVHVVENSPERANINYKTSTVVSVGHSRPHH